MSTGDVVYVLGTLLAVMGICSLPLLGSLRGASTRYRATILRQLVRGWILGTLVISWLSLGWFAIEAGGRWIGIYLDFTLVLMGAFFPLLIFGIRVSKRSAAAQNPDR